MGDVELFDKDYVEDTDELMPTQASEDWQDDFLSDEEDDMLDTYSAEDIEETVRLPEHSVRLGQYYILPEDMKKPLGSGGQAKVYYCHKENSNELLVAKLYQMKGDDKRLQEIQNINQSIMSMSRCRNLVRILEEGKTGDGRFYMIVMQKYAPVPKDFLNYKKYGHQKEYAQKFYRAVSGLVNALQYIHVETIRHGDIKPTNILLDGDPQGDFELVLADFGGSVLARENAPQGQSITGAAMTLAYTAPEQIAGQNIRASESADIYSAGLSLLSWVAGVLPKLAVLKGTDAGEAQKVYWEQNHEKGRNVFGVLLPKELPEYMVRFFEGVLYANLEDPSENSQYRWGNDDIKKWLSAVYDGDYEKAAELPSGADKKGNEHKPSREENSVFRSTRPRIQVILNKKPIAIDSEQQLAMVFLGNWQDIITKMQGESERWLNAFAQWPDIQENLRQIREMMREEGTDAEAVFDRMAIEPYLPDSFKRGHLRFYNTSFESKQYFGERLYSVLREWKQRSGGTYKLPNLKEEDLDSRNELTIILKMFSTGIISRFLEQESTEWNTSVEDVKLIKNCERLLAKGIKNKREKADLITDLYLIAFHMQDFTCFAMDGRYFQNYTDLLKEIRSVCDEGKAEDMLALQKQCMNAQGKLRVDLYAFMLEADGVVKRPQVTEREVI